jgi:HEAT repeat protein
LVIALAGPAASARQSDTARGGQVVAQQPLDVVTPAALKGAIDQLGTFEFSARTAAARTVRRAEAAMAVPALLTAVTDHPDSYVRFRALVLLSGFNDPRTLEVMRKALDEKNDRLRAVAYTYFEHNPNKAVLPVLLAAVERENSEFVRPALTRALAAYGDEPAARETMKAFVMRGQAIFRSSVIEALGDYRAAYALAPITEVARTDGPLQDDAALALGKIGDKSSLTTLASLQRTAPRESQPAIAAAICLLGVNCESHQRYLIETLKFAIRNIGFQDLVRTSATGLATLAAAGRDEAAGELIRQGGPTQDPARAAIALAVGMVAIRNPPLMLKVLAEDGLLEPGAELLREAFDMFEEDYEEERFFAMVRRAYWQAPAGSTVRTVGETLIRKLEF